jgi:hypothetical protein
VATTQAECISDTVEFFPRESNTPSLSAPEAAIIAAEALAQVLSHPAVSTTKAHNVVTATSALHQLSTLYNTKQEAAAPRVEASPRVVASPRVIPAIEPIAAPLFTNFTSNVPCILTLTFVKSLSGRQYVEPESIAVRNKSVSKSTPSGNALTKEDALALMIW